MMSEKFSLPFFRRKSLNDGGKVGGEPAKQQAVETIVAKQPMSVRTSFDVAITERVESSEEVERFIANIFAIQIVGKTNGQWEGLIDFFAVSPVSVLKTIETNPSDFAPIAWGKKADCPINIFLPTARLPSIRVSEFPAGTMKVMLTSYDGKDASNGVISFCLHVNLMDGSSRPTLLLIDVVLDKDKITDFINQCTSNHSFPLEVVQSILPRIELIPKDVSPQSTVGRFDINENKLVITYEPLKQILLVNSI